MRLLCVLSLLLVGCQVPEHFAAFTLHRVHVVGCRDYIYGSVDILDSKQELHALHYTSSSPKPICTSWNSSTYWDITLETTKSFRYNFVSATAVK